MLPYKNPSILCLYLFFNSVFATSQLQTPSFIVEDGTPKIRLPIEDITKVVKAEILRCSMRCKRKIFCDLPFESIFSQRGDTLVVEISSLALDAGFEYIIRVYFPEDKFYDSTSFTFDKEANNFKITKFYENPEVIYYTKRTKRDSEQNFDVKRKK